jgi:hypothetical protein
VRTVDVAALEDLQRSEQLASRPVLSAAVEAQCRQRVDGQDVTKVAAVVALDAPDGDQDVRRSAVARGRGVDFGANLRQVLLAQRDALGRHRAVEVVPRRARELGLRTVAFNDAREVLDVVERDAQRLLGNACRACADAEVGDPALEIPLQRGFIGSSFARFGFGRRNAGDRSGRRLGCRRRHGSASRQGRHRQRHASQPGATGCHWSRFVHRCHSHLLGDH